LPNVGPYIYDVSISGFTRSSIYIHDISSLRVNNHLFNPLLLPNFGSDYYNNTTNILSIFRAMG